VREEEMEGEGERRGGLTTMELVWSTSVPSKMHFVINDAYTIGIFKPVTF
jgi:hypothetical protein